MVQRRSWSQSQGCPPSRTRSAPPAPRTRCSRGRGAAPPPSAPRSAAAPGWRSARRDAVSPDSVCALLVCSSFLLSLLSNSIDLHVFHFARFRRKKRRRTWNAVRSLAVIVACLCAGQKGAGKAGRDDVGGKIEADSTGRAWAGPDPLSWQQTDTVFTTTSYILMFRRGRWTSWVSRVTPRYQNWYYGVKIDTTVSKLILRCQDWHDGIKIDTTVSTKSYVTAGCDCVIGDATWKLSSLVSKHFGSVWSRLTKCKNATV